MSGLKPAEIVESLEYMSDVFMGDERFRQVVDDGEMDSYTMDGDDLAGFCWHFDRILKWAGVKRSVFDRERERQARGEIQHPSNPSFRP